MIKALIIVQSLGRAGSCVLDTRKQARMGLILFDVSDFNRIHQQGTLQDVIAHEMGHGT